MLKMAHVCEFSILVQLEEILRKKSLFLVHKVEYRIGNYIYIYVCMLIYDTDRYKYFMLINED